MNLEHSKTLSRHKENLMNWWFKHTKNYSHHGKKRFRKKDNLLDWGISIIELFIQNIYYWLWISSDRTK